MRNLSALAIPVFLVPAMAMATSVGTIELKHSSSPNNRNINIKFTLDTSTYNVKTGLQILELKDGSASADYVAQQLWQDALPKSHGDNKLYTTYCIDFHDHAPSAFTEYEILTPLSEGPDPSGMTDDKANQLSWLWDNHFVDSLGNEIDSAAFQAAVWEIVNETSSDLTVSDGFFYAYHFDDLDGTAKTAMDQANVWLDLAKGQTGYNSTTTTFYALSDPDKQDYVYLTSKEPTAPPSVPEPMTMVSLASAIAAAGAYLKRRRNA